jgi:putative multiple sugar transport system substrate-binding protein
MAMVLVACGGDETADEPDAEEPSSTETTEETTEVDAPEVEAGSVGIVLPTKEEPRWIQDEARFKDAFDTAGYEVEILFSEGDSAKERANVEDLITKGVQCGGEGGLL